MSDRLIQVSTDCSCLSVSGKITRVPRPTKNHASPPPIFDRPQKLISWWSQIYRFTTVYTVQDLRIVSSQVAGSYTWDEHYLPTIRAKWRSEHPEFFILVSKGSSSSSSPSPTSTFPFSGSCFPSFPWPWDDLPPWCDMTSYRDIPWIKHES